MQQKTGDCKWHGKCKWKKVKYETLLASMIASLIIKKIYLFETTQHMTVRHKSFFFKHSLYHNTKAVHYLIHIVNCINNSMSDDLLNSNKYVLSMMLKESR